MKTINLKSLILNIGQNPERVFKVNSAIFRWYQLCQGMGRRNTGKKNDSIQLIDFWLASGNYQHQEISIILSSETSRYNFLKLKSNQKLLLIYFFVSFINVLLVFIRLKVLDIKYKIICIRPNSLRPGICIILWGLFRII